MSQKRTLTSNNFDQDLHNNSNINLNSPNLVLETIFEWKGAGNDYEQINLNIWTSKCKLRIYRTYSMPVIIICSDLDESETGTSITNSCERLATLIWNKYKEEELAKNPGFLFIEHYPRHNQAWGDVVETFCLVQFNFDGEKFSS
ncbi:hypothetical protein CEN49_03520 [Fischerella thermalis CCMEE 5273]|uniref:Uncharacterized protein n=1 Tax=Chlorogloeopsis fritschii PCC 6912 TaxID=211165 RepID=A0A433NLH5_CHLFR|nr:hypothetical protein [Chlorogloeopsis fritschii]PMB10684.1 hypothetical protein CEN49_03520 [Fischerella thermalis CCMEE 5273]PMB50494.1 hypothetical protein CEN40_01780 [Fischerella thermalis CCMEE 5205]RUR83786.1 hypothetical protein PCC6912_20290 [Chlorogloeopsis fritschii PCC 6912]